MTKVEFKFDETAKVQTSDGRDGTIAALCFERDEKFYHVRVLTTKKMPDGTTRGIFNWHYLPESELSLRRVAQPRVEENELAR